jgi:hypothetical protein
VRYAYLDVVIVISLVTVSRFHRLVLPSQSRGTRIRIPSSALYPHHITPLSLPLRKETEDAKLMMSSVFGTAKATQEADNVMILQSVQGMRSLEVKKNRFDGEVGSIDLDFDRDSNKFVEVGEGGPLDSYGTGHDGYAGPAGPGPADQQGYAGATYGGGHAEEDAATKGDANGAEPDAAPTAANQDIVMW